MVKKLYALTNVKHNDEWFDANTELDPGKFTKEQLQSLYDNGAVEVRESDTYAKSNENPYDESVPVAEGVPDTSPPGATDDVNAEPPKR